MSTLGERIRTLRKQQKMTLEALAGTELTKGMLSLIENNKANPSMESLNYIASQLGVEVTELLEEISGQELRKILDQAELLFNTKYDEHKDEFKRVMNLIEPLIPKLTQGYEATRLLELYGRCLSYSSPNESVVLLQKVSKMYEDLNLITKRAEIGTYLAIIPFMNHQYQEALDILLAERKKLEANPLWIDPLSRMDYDYYEAAFYFAVGKYEDAIRMMNEAIQYSNEHKIFNHIDNLFRLAAAQAMMEEDVEKMDYYLKKLEAYSEFADDEDSRVFIHYANIHYLNTFKKRYEEADALYHKFSIDQLNVKLFTPYFLLERGKTLYGLGRLEEAFVQLDKVTIPEITHHPIDLSIFYEKDAYIALCYLEQNQIEKAIRAVKVAMTNVKEMPDTPYKIFIQNVYEKVMKH
ncbi:helix-turn-helix transcriptional regulator [Psychrobacillus sp. INOP01]|uniref:helix-turn-helix domain-containing protein n=1 Tax=Psychrobacillus sp. INOP01 TaxID=2829187 RepID=UPI001BAE1395|nr:helix-turn-helix transcriptional regulator [Psychrobacillus sp. INOP01]QUG43201.1 helix-turn-helix transcriptional regulator [Psychrobacillus sp. INOP01]